MIQNIYKELLNGMSDNGKKHVAKNYGNRFGGSSLVSTKQDQRFVRPESVAGWKAASASYAMNSSGQVKSLVGTSPWGRN